MCVRIYNHYCFYCVITATSKDVIDYFNHFLTTEMDCDSILQHSLTKQLLNDQEVRTIMGAVSDHQKNCLVVEKVRLMETNSLESFCELLQKFDCQKHIANVLLNGKLRTIWRGTLEMGQFGKFTA